MLSKRIPSITPKMTFDDSLDELELLFEPLKEGIESISRAAGRYTYPANFMLVAANEPLFLQLTNKNKLKRA